MFTQDDLRTLEGLCDRYDLIRIMEALSTICHEKAERLESNWQDSVAAKCWRRNAAKIDRCTATLD